MLRFLGSGELQTKTTMIYHTTITKSWILKMDWESARTGSNWESYTVRLSTSVTTRSAVALTTKGEHLVCKPDILLLSMLVHQQHECEYPEHVLLDNQVSTNNKMDRFWYIHSMYLYEAEKSNKLLLCVKIKINLINVIREDPDTEYKPHILKNKWNSPMGTDTRAGIFCDGDGNWLETNRDATGCPRTAKSG